MFTQESIAGDFSSFLNHIAASYSKKTAIQIKKKSRYESLTYHELNQRVISLSRGLYDLGIRKGSHVVIVAENSLEWVLAYFAVMVLGAVAIPLDTKLSEKELLVLLKHCQPVAAFTSVALRGIISRNMSALPFLKHVICLEEPGSEKDTGAFPDFETLLKSSGNLPRVSVDGDDIAAIIYTSGTTGQPKGAMLSHRNLLYNPQVVADHGPFRAEDRSLILLPLHHVYPLNTLLTGLSLGLTTTFLSSLKPGDIQESMKENEISVLVGVPRLIEFIHDGIFEKIARASKMFRVFFQIALRISRHCQVLGGLRISKMIFWKIHHQFGGNLRIITSGGASLKPEIFMFFKDIGILILEGYGLTESSGCIVMNISKPKARASGKALRYTNVKIHADENGIGEIAVSGPSVFKGYYKNEAATNEILDQGMLYTGDLGRFDDDGYLYITGRRKDVIVLPSGKNVYPDEIEALYGQSSLIKQIAVIGLNRGHGEEVFACIVPNYNGSLMTAMPEREVIENRIKEHLVEISKALSSHKRISGYKFFDEDFPTTSLNKIKKYELRKLMDSGAALHQNDFKGLGLSKNAFEQKILYLLENYLKKRGIHQVRLQSHLELDLGIDSLGRAELMASLKKTFDLHHLDDEFLSVETVQDIVLLLERHGSSACFDRADSLEKIDWHSVLNQEPIDVWQKGQKVFDSCPRLRKIFLILFRGVFRIWTRLRISGLEHLPMTGPYILAVNHESHLDNLFVACFLPSYIQENMAVISKQEHFDRWFTRLIAKLCHAVPLKRDSIPTVALQIASCILRQGKVLLIHPEGTRSPDGQLLPFKNGVALLALHHRCPIVPVYIEGANEFWPKNSLLPKLRGNISVNIGACIHSKEFGASQPPENLIQSADDLTRILRDCMFGLKDRISYEYVSHPQTDKKTLSADHSR